mmetsp:Transcript_11505/g.18714  ORF Transcript_11505/g.18714 Transcript_11505/m.18714 type:complete len:83 (+) Transcript_11505:1105-1353(+)
MHAGSCLLTILVELNLVRRGRLSTYHFTQPINLPNKATKRFPEFPKSPNKALWLDPNLIKRSANKYAHKYAHKYAESSSSGC